MRKLAASVIAIMFALTACGGGDSADSGGGGESDTRSEGVWGTDIKFGEVDGGPITQGTTTIALSNAQVVDVDGGQQVEVDVTISHSEVDPVKFPAMMFVCHANETGSTLDLGRRMTGGTSHVQPGDEFAGVLSFEIPADRELGEGCMDGAYIDVRHNADLGGGANLFNESLITSVFRLDTSTIATIK